MTTALNLIVGIAVAIVAVPLVQGYLGPYAQVVGIIGVVAIFAYNRAKNNEQI